MASSLEYVQFVYEQFSELEDISYRKMFGEYVFYHKGKIFGGIYDNRFLIKVTEAGKKLMPDCKMEYPYDGGKLMFLAQNLDNKEFLKRLVIETCSQLPNPKVKKVN